jgi:hypothetical protein
MRRLVPCAFTFVAPFAIAGWDESEDSERGRGMAQRAIGLGFLNVAASCAVVILVATQLGSQ